MQRPFKIFPSLGYKNSQFQIVSSVDNLKIDIYNQDKIIASVDANSKYPTVLNKLNATGKLIAKCKLSNTEFEQEIEIKEAFRLGSSEFKNAFVFDDTDYSFFLMKDRLLLYDEKKKILHTENHFSPTEIHKIDKTNFLFVTKVGNSAGGIINLGIYNIDSFSLVGELLNDYREIKILPENNKAWLYNIKSKKIHCFELAHQSNRYLTELKSFENFNDYFLDAASQNIYLNNHEVLQISSLNNLQQTIEIYKNDNNAIDKSGNVFTLENRTLTCRRLHTNSYETANPNFEFNLQSENYIHVGKLLKSEDEALELNKKLEEIKEELIYSLPDNITYHYHELSDAQKTSDVFTTHRIYPTKNGIFIIQKSIKRVFNGVTLKKEQNYWTATPYNTENTETTLLLFNSGKVETLIDKSSNLIVQEYHNDMLVVNHQNIKILFSGRNKISLNTEDSTELFTINGIGYFLINTKEKYSLFRSTDPNKVILEQIEILNYNLFEKHQIIWYRDNDISVFLPKNLKAFDLKSCSTVFIGGQKAQALLFKDAFDFKFFEKYALSSNQIVYNPKTLEIKDAFIGSIESHSKQLNKIVSHRTNIIYLSIFNSQLGKYELSEISIDDNKYKESYLSPDGQFLVLQDESNKYSFFDIEKGETIKFISGNFLAFKSDGSLLLEEDGTRAVKIIDPKTFQDITPPNYHHYIFISPDGKLYAQVSSKARYYHKLNKRELKIEEVSALRQELDNPSPKLSKDEKEQAKFKIEKNRLKIFTEFKKDFQSLGIKNHKAINSKDVIQINKYIEIGIVGTEIKKEISIPNDTHFYNYASFSFDNNYLGIVGKPIFGSINRSLILICRLSFDDSNQKLELVNYTVSRFPRYAAWVCGFSKNGYFATYDSSPDTFLIKMDEFFFSDVTSDLELKNNIFKSRSNIYNTYKKWNVIKDKNFLCFSPSGNFLALSEQGYEPLTLGGYGHQESNVVHIAKTESGAIINSFTGHGDKIKDDIRKKVTFVAFAQDESRIMSLSSDGVVIIRDINKIIDEQTTFINQSQTIR
jgi:hypothetical protein